MGKENKAFRLQADLEGDRFRIAAGETEVQTDPESRARVQIAEKGYAERFLEGIRETEKGPEKKGIGKRIVIEGSLGDAVRKRYWPAIREYFNSGLIDIWLTDIQDKMPDYLKEFLTEDIEHQSRIRYLNKDRGLESRGYRNLSDIDDVFIATWDSTHCDIAMKWLGRARRIFIEKPLDSSLKRAERLLNEIEKHNYGTEVLCFDHYRAKALPLRQNINGYLDMLDRNIKKISFYLTEPRTIEAEERVKALSGGLILDLLPHLFALLMYIGPLDSITKNQIEIMGAKYRNAKIPNETFAAARFPMKSYGHDEITVEAFVGKAVGRSDDPAMYHHPIPQKTEIKYFEIENNSVKRKRLRFDFALEPPKLFYLEDDPPKEIGLGDLDGTPHHSLIDSIIRDTYDENPRGFYIGEGVKILDLLEACRNRCKTSGVGTYNVGEPPENICRILAFPSAIYK